MYYKKNLDFVALFWEDLAYQIDNKDSKKQEKTLYPRFTKIIIHHFLKKDKSISMRNRTFMHTARDDSLLGTMRFISRHEYTQVYGAILPKSMANQAMLDSVAYKTYYAIALGAEPLKSKKPKTKSDSAISSEETPSKKNPTKAKKDVPSTKKPANKTKPTTKKAPVKTDRGKGFLMRNNVRSLSWGDSGEEDDDDKDHTEDDKGNDDGDGNDDGGDDDNDHEWTESDKDENLNLNQSNVEHKEEENVDEFTNKEDDEENEEESDDGWSRSTQCLLRVRVLAGRKRCSCDTYNCLDIQKTEVRHEEPNGQTSTLFIVPITVIPKTIPPSPYFFNTLPQQTTPTPTPTALEVTTAFLALLDFVSVFRFNDRVTNLERDLEEAQAEKQDYIDLVDSTVRTIIREEVKTQLPQILPKVVLDFATHVIEQNVIESLEASFLARPLAGLDRWTKGRKSSKEAESQKDLRSKEGKSSSSSKDTSRSHHKSSGKSAHAEEPSHIVDDSRVQKNQEFNTGNNDEQPEDEAAAKNGWFKKPKRPLTLDPDWNKRQHVDFRPLIRYQASPGRSLNEAAMVSCVLSGLMIG
nr:hypothetical protein [Tanacetum cinerariifolium]